MRSGIVAALGLASCMFGQIEVRPTDEWFTLACQSINVNPDRVLHRNFSFDARKMAVHGPFSDLRKRRLDGKYHIDVVAYLEYLNRRLLTPPGKVIAVTDVTIETGRGGVTAQDAPVFSIKLVAADGSSRKIEVEKAAIGPAYSVFKVRDPGDPIAVRSANIACFAAFLRIALALEE